MREFSVAWKWTIDEKMGIFSNDSVATGNERPHPLPVIQHTLLIQVIIYNCGDV